MSGKLKNKIKILILIASCVLSLIVFGVIFIWSGLQTGSLVDQQAAERWSSVGGYAQNSLYFTLGSGLKQDEIYSLRRAIDSALTAESVDSKYDERGWLDSYYSERSVTAKRNSATCQATAVGIGGDFFIFHPAQLLNGAYISESDLMHDLAVIDDLAAWFLFGSNNCVGMDFTIDGQSFIVAGVVERDDGDAMKLAYGDSARIYISFEMLGADEISMYETLIPNAIPEFAQKLVIKATQKDEGTYAAVESTDRFSIAHIYELIKDSPKNAMRTVAIAFPFWENAARVVESHMTRAYAAMLILLLYPAVVLVVFAIRLWRRRTWRLTVFIKTAWGKIYDIESKVAAVKKKKQREDDAVQRAAFKAAYEKAEADKLAKAEQIDEQETEEFVIK